VFLYVCIFILVEPKTIFHPGGQ